MTSCDWKMLGINSKVGFMMSLRSVSTADACEGVWENIEHRLLNDSVSHFVRVWLLRDDLNVLRTATLK